MDTRDTRFQNLLFLLSAAPIGLGCVITSDDTTSDTEAATENPTTGTPTSTTENPTTGNTAEDTTAGPVSTDDRGETTETPADSTTAGPAETTTGGQVVPESCSTYADLVTMCYDAEAGAAAASYCADAFANYEMNYGAECVAAFEDWLACLSALTCEEFTGADPVCMDQSAALETPCAAM